MRHPHTRPRPHRRRPLAPAAALAAAGLLGAGLTTLAPDTAEAATARQVEALDRGVVSVHTDAGNLVSWRWLGTDPDNVAFNVYRAGTKVNSSPVTGSTTFFHSGAPAQADYTVRAVVNGTEQGDSVHAVQFRAGYKDVPISPPSGGTTPDGVSYTYEANDASVGDLDGDGALDIVLKWQPTNAKDNSQSGYTGNTIVDGIRLDGTRLWRVDLGRNIRSGAHYTQFQVYDYDGDGRAEVAMKTADGTKDGTGAVIGSSSADHRNSSGYVLAGPEYLSMFDGRPGRA
ncbi:rhamnogalacturonan lyase family protein, partial [Streptomyces ardesiacus]